MLVSHNIHVLQTLEGINLMLVASCLKKYCAWRGIMPLKLFGWAIRVWSRHFGFKIPSTIRHLMMVLFDMAVAWICNSSMAMLKIALHAQFAVDATFSLATWHRLPAYLIFFFRKERTCFQEERPN